MKFRNIMLILLLALAVLSLGAVSATDNLTDEGVLQQDYSQEIELSEDSGENSEISSSEVNEPISQTEESVLTQSVEVSSYSELANKIEAAKGTNLKEYTINLKGGTYSATGNMIEWGSSSGTKTLIINGNGATLDGNNQHAFIKVNQDYTLVLNNIRIVNYAKYGTSGFVDNIYGGAVYVADFGSLVIDHCEFANNHAKYGGAIYSDGILVIRNSIFTKNSADSGGAIETNEGKCDIQSSVFENNNAQTGGAIYAGSNGAIITNNIFTNNEAGKSGGAIHNGFWKSHDYNIVIYDRWGNRIESEREYFGLDTSIIKNIFAYNKAKEGSAINNVVCSILIDSNEFHSNSASSSASQVIVNDQADVDISGNVIQGTKYYSTISNSGRYSKITNNLFDDAHDKTFTISGAGTYLVSNAGKASTKKATPKLTAKKATFKVKIKVKKYSAILKTNKNKAIKKVKLYLKVKGKTYTAKTNSKGKATFKIKNLKKKGTYKATVTFKGNKNYKKVTKKVKIIVK